MQTPAAGCAFKPCRCQAGVERPPAVTRVAGRGTDGHVFGYLPDLDVVIGRGRDAVVSEHRQRQRMNAIPPDTSVIAQRLHLATGFHANERDWVVNRLAAFGSRLRWYRDDQMRSGPSPHRSNSAGGVLARGAAVCGVALESSMDLQARKNTP